MTPLTKAKKDQRNYRVQLPNARRSRSERTPKAPPAACSNRNHENRGASVHRRLHVGAMASVRADAA